MTISLDSSRCVSCGICAKNCPVSYIVKQGEDKVSFNENNAKFLSTGLRPSLNG